MTTFHNALTRTGFAGAITAAALALAPAAHAGVVVGWTFENASGGQISNIAASTTAADVSAATFNTGNNGVENWGGSIGKLSLTRFFNNTNTLPSLSFTLANSFDNLTLSFTSYHNHNPRFPTYQQYNYAVQINDGSGWTNVMADLIASNATSGTEVDLALPHGLSAGTYGIRWIGYGFAFGNNSNTEFFALDNVTLTSAVPEPASLALVALALAGVGAVRRKRA